MVLRRNMAAGPYLGQANLRFLTIERKVKGMKRARGQTSP
jgi:hypothetical protein